ncbi:hypothetical protein [Candidatus Neptunichlamydia sp. REUL1]|uniref:hypothetical protein n=1 Tax=Candidatus Neptunichlamydia sp. REUL1 TaxID=3064277 RepID=UPI00292F305B|nr:hypothetical protein [Candidatus Neptunochlamydia sp. REUL1]
MNVPEKFNMVEECTQSYRVKKLGENGIEIFIKIPKRFESLWMHTLSDLETTMKEIEYYEKDE